jgi:hypothetical protein
LAFDYIGKDAGVAEFFSGGDEHGIYFVVLGLMDALDHRAFKVGLKMCHLRAQLLAQGDDAAHKRPISVIGDSLYAAESIGLVYGSGIGMVTTVETNASPR